MFLVFILAVVSQAAVLKTTEGLIHSSISFPGSGDPDHAVVSGTWPNGTIKFQPGGNYASRLPGNTFVFIISRYAFFDGYFYWRFQDSNDWYRIFFDFTSGSSYVTKWQKQVAGGSITDIATSSTITGSSAHLYKIVVSFSGSTTTVSVYSRQNSAGYGSVTTEINAATDSLPAGWSTGQFRMQETNASGGVQYYLFTREDDIEVTDLPSNREAMICDEANNYFGKATSASPIFTIGSTAIQPFQGRIKIKTDTDADDCTSGTIHETYYTHTLLGGDIFVYRSEAQILAPSYGIARWNGTNFDVPVRGVFNASGDMKVGYKLTTDSWPGTACTGTETCTSTIATTATNYFHRAFVTVPGLSASTSYNFRVHHGSNIQTGEMLVKVPASPTSTGTLKVCYSTCETTEKRPYVLWDRMDQIGCDITIFLGDKYYESHGNNMSSGSPTWEPIADTRAEYEIKMLDVLHDPRMANYSLTHAIGYIWDDHDSGCNDGVPKWDLGFTTTNIRRCLGGNFFPQQLFADAKTVWDDFITGINPTPLRSGTNYFAFKQLSVEFLVPDHMSYRDHYDDIDRQSYGAGVAALNTAFESCTSSGQDPPSWTNSNPGSGSNGCSTTEVFSGTYNFHARNNEYISQSFSARSGATYILKTVAKMQDSATGGSAVIMMGTSANSSDRCTTSTTSTSNTNLSCSFTAGSNETVHVTLKGTNATWNSFFDTVTVVSYGSTALQNVTGTATNGGSTITCSACDFVIHGVEPGDRVKYEGRWYKITSRDSATVVSVSPNVVCSTCNGSTDVLTYVKTMLETDQFVDFANRLKDSTATTFIHMFSKVLYWTSDVHQDTWAYAFCTPKTQGTNCVDTNKGYQKELVLYRDYACNNSGSGSDDFFATGDSHFNLWTDHTDVSGCTHREVLVAGLGTPSHSPMMHNYGNSMTNHEIRGMAYGRSFGLITINTAASPDTVRYQVYGENGDVLIDTSNSNQVVFNNNSSAVATRQAKKIIRHSSGRCVVLIYNGTYQELRLSNNTDCTWDTSNYQIAVNGTITLDRGGSIGAIAINGDTVYSCYAGGNTDATDHILYARTATITGATIAWNADQTQITDQGTSIRVQHIDFVRDSNGYLHCSFTAFNESNSFYAVKSRKSTNANSISAWDADVNHIGGTTAIKVASLINTGSGKVLLAVYNGAATPDYQWNEYTGSAWCFALNTLGTIDSSVSITNGNSDGSGDGSGGALVAYFNDTTSENIGVKRFTSNATCASGTWSSEILLATPEVPRQPQTVFVRSKYWVLAHNNHETPYVFRSSNSTPSAASDFLEVADTLPLERHFRYNRFNSMQDGGNYLTLMYEGSSQINGTFSDGPQVRAFSILIPSGVGWPQNEFEFGEEYEQWIDSLKPLLQ
jgi:hypothetical protein